MNKVLIFLLIFSVAAMVNGFYVLTLYAALLGIIIAIVTLIPLLKQSRKIVDLYLGMPTVWQNIRETLELGVTLGLLTKVTTTHRAREFYACMEAHEELFEIKVNEQLIKAFDAEYDKELQLQEISTIGKALYYFCCISQENPERLPEILSTVQVRKKVGGKKQDPEKENTMVLTPIYFA